MLFEDNVPYQFRAGAKACAAAVKQFNNVLIATHVNMDGDALGSLMACGNVLKSSGIAFALYSSSGVPHNLDFIPFSGHVYRHLTEIPFKPECAIYLDCSDVARLGDELARCYQNFASINIDHHIGGRGLGSVVNYIDSDAAATSQLVAYFAMALDFQLKDALAQAIALGLMTDTGGFCHGNTTADVFSLCALLARNGCKMSDIRENLQNSWTLNRLHLWGELFTRLKLVFDKKIAVCTVTHEDLANYHCSVEDLEGLIDKFRRIHGVKVAAILREDAGGICKFSLRSYGKVDVRSMAAELGGGGHQNAAGGSLVAPLDRAKTLLLEIIRQKLEAFERYC